MRKLTISIALGLSIAVGLWLGLAAAISGGRGPVAGGQLTSARTHAGVTSTTTRIHGTKPVSSIRSAESTTEAPESENASETETVDHETGANEPQPGHEDPAGQNVNHECTGNCVE